MSHYVRIFLERLIKSKKIPSQALLFALDLSVLLLIMHWLLSVIYGTKVSMNGRRPALTLAEEVTAEVNTCSSITLCTRVSLLVKTAISSP
jgi:hypothetical protein